MHRTILENKILKPKGREYRLPKEKGSHKNVLITYVSEWRISIFSTNYDREY
jgi:hypothetical protein